MKQILLLPTLLLSLSLITSCSKSNSASQKKDDQKITIPKIDLTHWKVTVPAPTSSGKPIEVEPPEIFDYANNEQLKEFMYNDTTDGSLVFYAFPAASTRNSSYSRSELREQMVSGSNSTNWTFKQGGRMKVTMSVPEVTKDSKGKYHRIIIAQIHGRLTNEQKKLIGQKDNNAPPILKIYWDKGRIRVKTKVMKNKNATDEELLHTKAWGDDKGYNFLKPVDKKKFTLEIIVSEGRMEIVLNGRERQVYKDKHIKRWGLFENYFKVGNYFNTRDKGAHGKVKIYDLEVSH